MAVSVSVVRTVVDGEMGEVTINFTNGTNAVLHNVHVNVIDNGPATPGAMGSIAYIPSQADGGYAVGDVAANAQAHRTFAMKPLDAEPGKKYNLQAVVTWQGGPNAHEEGNEQVLVEARPEVYAALGASERLRQVLIGAYEDFKTTGKSVHQNQALPDTKGEPVSYSLQPNTFQWALGVLEQGVRLFKDQKKTTGNTP